jgi:hypothetical protein
MSQLRCRTGGGVPVKPEAPPRTPIILQHVAACAGNKPKKRGKR